MNYKRIEAHERSFFQTGKGIAKSNFKLEVKIWDGLPYIKVTPTTNKKSYYFSEKNEKTAAVLHFTEGYMKSDLYYLSHKGNISVPFILARNGTIVNLHPSTCWSYHLGPGASGGNATMSKATVGIELSNIGALSRDGDNLLTRYKDVYCTVQDTEAYCKLDEPFRNFTYYATYTNAQYEHLTILLKYLNRNRGIELNFLPKDKRYKKLSSAEVKKFRGILSHINFRNDLDENGRFKKVDIGPAFDWDRLEESLK